jgi:hypothetical protein
MRLALMAIDEVGATSSYVYSFLGASFFCEWRSCVFFFSFRKA